MSRAEKLTGKAGAGEIIFSEGSEIDEAAAIGVDSIDVVRTWLERWCRREDNRSLMNRCRPR